MKKGLLLSVVASGFIFAGGNIAPVEPVQPQVAPAACDFWGTLAMRLDMNKAGAYNFGDDENNAFTTAIAMGVEKDLGYGFGIGAELGALKQFDIGIASAKSETAELSQLYVTYKAGNTAIKAGRQALPKSLSPWAWSDRTAGVLDTSFEGVVVVNTDLPDTVLAGAWIARAGSGSTFSKVNGVDNKGLFALAAQYKGISNTTLTGTIYYVTEAKVTSAWASAETKAGNVDLGLQVAYAKQKGTKATLGVAGYAATKFDAVDAKLTLAYLNNGATTLNLGGTSGFWGATYYVFGGDVNAALGKQKIARLDVGYTLANNSRIYAGVAADKPDTGKTAVAARLGYDFKVADVNAKVEYRYSKDFAGNKAHRIRVQGVYKF